MGVGVEIGTGFYNSNLRADNNIQQAECFTIPYSLSPKLRQLYRRRFRNVW